MIYNIMFFLVAMVLIIAALLAMIAAPLSLGFVVWWGAAWALKPNHRGIAIHYVKLGGAVLAVSVCYFLFFGWLMTIFWPSVP